MLYTPPPNGVVVVEVVEEEVVVVQPWGSNGAPAPTARSIVIYPRASRSAGCTTCFIFMLIYSHSD